MLKKLPLVTCQSGGWRKNQPARQLPSGLVKNLVQMVKPFADERKVHTKVGQHSRIIRAITGKQECHPRLRQVRIALGKVNIAANLETADAWVTQFLESYI